MDQSNWTEEQRNAMNALHDFVLALSEQAGKGEEYGKTLWGRITNSVGVLRELAYFHDTGEFWGKYEVAGYTLTDIVVWQVDHFKAYMDRVEMNRFHRERLFLESLEVLLDMEENPEKFVRKMAEESGQDSENY